MRSLKIIIALFFGMMSFFESSFAECGEKKIVINLPSRSLALYDGDKKVRLYPIAIGKPSSTTPVGYFKIRSKDKNPTWTDPSNHKNVVPSGPSNPLGYRWMLLYGNYGIHGTNNPNSIGHFVSNGCIRMREENVEELFELVEIGTPVEINYNRVIVEKTPEGVVAYYVYPDIYGRQKLTVDMIKTWLKGFGVENFVTDDDVEKKIKASDGTPTFVGKSNTIVLNGEKLKDKAVQFDGVMYLPAEKIAEKLDERLEWNQKTGVISTNYDISQGALKNNVLYMDARDLKKLFQVQGGLNDDMFIIGDAQDINANHNKVNPANENQNEASAVSIAKPEENISEKVSNNTAVNKTGTDNEKRDIAPVEQKEAVNADSVSADKSVEKKVKKGDEAAEKKKAVKKGKPVIVRNTKKNIISSNKGARD